MRRRRQRPFEFFAQSGTVTAFEKDAGKIWHKPTAETGSVKTKGNPNGRERDLPVPTALLAAGLLLFVLGCATQGFPPGGPVDKTPPEIVRTEPGQHALNVPRNEKVTIWFSEKIDPRSLKDAVFISPNPGKRVKIRLKGKRLEIRFLDSLLADVTYTVTLGTGLQDLRRNRLRESFTLAFSTGSKLDRNWISGRVFAEKPQEVTVWAYFLPPGGDVFPWKQEPQYITQCGADGRFRLNNLARRSYRLFAVRDRNKNRLAEPRLDDIGLTWRDVSLQKDSSGVDGRLFRLMKLDTSRVHILDLLQPDRRHLYLRFSREVLPLGPVLLRGPSGKTYPVLSISVPQDAPAVWHIATPPRAADSIQVTIVGVGNRRGQVWRDTLRAGFRSTDRPDTARPRLLVIHPPDSSRVVLPDQAIEFQFSEALDSTSFVRGFSLWRDSVRCRPRIKWQNLAAVSILPAGQRWSYGTWYHLKLEPAQISDLAGNPLLRADSVYSWRVVPEDTLSAVLGTVADEDTTDTSSVVLELRDLVRDTVVRSIRLDAPGPYRFDPVLPGKYAVQGFRDRDGNGRYSYGSVLPFVPAERFFVGQDTILVRARWPNEGNNYRFKK